MMIESGSINYIWNKNIYIFLEIINMNKYCVIFGFWIVIKFLFSKCDGFLILEIKYKLLLVEDL